MAFQPYVWNQQKFLTQVLKKWNSFFKDWSWGWGNIRGKLLLHQRALQTTFTGNSWFNLLLQLQKSFLYPSNGVSRICEKGKWLHIMFVTPHLQSLSPVLISSQCYLYRCSRHFTETPSSSEEFLFHKSCVFASPPPPRFLYTERIVCCGMKALSNMQVSFTSVVSNCVKTMLVCVGGVSGTAFPFV